jgi:hypothetical protein
VRSEVLTANVAEDSNLLGCDTMRRSSPETCVRPGQAINLVPLQTDILLNLLA